jgi:hypothetical protein
LKEKRISIPPDAAVLTAAQFFDHIASWAPHPVTQEEFIIRAGITVALEYVPTDKAADGILQFLKLDSFKEPVDTEGIQEFMSIILEADEKNSEGASSKYDNLDHEFLPAGVLQVTINGRTPPGGIYRLSLLCNGVLVTSNPFHAEFVSENSPPSPEPPKTVQNKTTRFEFRHIMYSAKTQCASLLKLNADGVNIRTEEVVSNARLVHVAPDDKEYGPLQVFPSLLALRVAVPHNLIPGNYKVVALVGGSIVESNIFTISADDVPSNHVDLQPAEVQETNTRKTTKRTAAKIDEKSVEPPQTRPQISQKAQKKKKKNQKKPPVAAETTTKASIMSVSSETRVSTWFMPQQYDGGLGSLYDLMSPYLESRPTEDDAHPVRLGPFDSGIVGSFTMGPSDDISAEKRIELWETSVRELNLRVESDPKRILRASIVPDRPFSVVLASTKAIVATMCGRAKDVSWGPESRRVTFLGSTRRPKFLCSRLPLTPPVQFVAPHGNKQLKVLAAIARRRTSEGAYEYCLHIFEARILQEIKRRVA